MRARAEFDAAIQQVTVELFRESPEFATYLGLPQEMMGGPYNHHWGDYGPEGDEAARAMARSLLPPSPTARRVTAPRPASRASSHTPYSSR